MIVRSLIFKHLGNYQERAGVLNLGIEGIMSVGAMVVDVSLSRVIYTGHFNCSNC